MAPEQQLYNGIMKATRAPGCALTAAAGNPPTTMQTRRQRPRNWCHGGAASTIPTAGNLQEVGHHHAASEVQRTPSRYKATRAPGCTLTATAGNTPTTMQTRRQRPFLTCTNLTGIYYIYTKVKFGTSPGMSACGMSHAPEQGSMGQGTSLYTDDMRTNFGFDEFFTIKRKKRTKKKKNWLP